MDKTSQQPECRNQNCRQGRDCPLRNAEKQEQSDQHMQELRAYELTVANRDARIAELEALLKFADERINKMVDKQAAKAAPQQKGEWSREVVQGYLVIRSPLGDSYEFPLSMLADHFAQPAAQAVPVEVPTSTSADDANARYGEAYGVDWVYTAPAHSADGVPAPVTVVDALQSLIEAIQFTPLGVRQIHAMERAREALAATHPTQQGLDAPKFLNVGDFESLERFAETAGDGQDYDIGKAAIARLAGFGCLQSHGFGKYSVTAFGDYILNDWDGARKLPFSTQAERHALDAAQAKQGEQANG